MRHEKSPGNTLVHMMCSLSAHASENFRGHLGEIELEVYIPGKLFWVEQMYHWWVPAAPNHTTINKRARLWSTLAYRQIKLIKVQHKCLSQARPYFLMLFDNMVIKMLLNFSTRPLHCMSVHDTLMCLSS